MPPLTIIEFLAATRSARVMQAGLYLLLLFALVSRGAYAEAPRGTSAAAVIGDCRDLANLVQFSGEAGHRRNLYGLGYCRGVIGGIAFAGRHYGICVPPAAIADNAVDIVVQYIDGNPEKTKENFMSLVIEALHQAWPCERERH